MTREERQERARQVAVRLTAEVRAVSPPAMWGEPFPPDLVRLHDDAFDLLNKWEVTGARELVPQVDRACRRIVAAWKRRAESADRMEPVGA